MTENITNQSTSDSSPITEQESLQILLVEDDSRQANLLEQFLRKHHHKVQAVNTAEDMYQVLQQKYFDLILLDLMLPGDSGIEACRKLRTKENPIPIIMLTARGDKFSPTSSLEIGADDYLAKPFNPDELLARIKAVLRRVSKVSPGTPVVGEKLTFGKFTLHLDSRELINGDEKHLLTTSEFAILRVLAANPGTTLTRDKLMRLAYDREWNATGRSIDVQISRLRRLIEENPNKPRHLQTVWGLGYVFIP